MVFLRGVGAGGAILHLLVLCAMPLHEFITELKIQEKLQLIKSSGNDRNRERSARETQI